MNLTIPKWIPKDEDAGYAWIGVLIALCILCAAICAEDYECVRPEGCECVLSNEKGSKKVTFREGDIVTTADGYVVNPSDGWAKVYSKMPLAERVFGTAVWGPYGVSGSETPKLAEYALPPDVQAVGFSPRAYLLHPQGMTATPLGFADIASPAAQVIVGSVGPVWWSSYSEAPWWLVTP